MIKNIKGALTDIDVDTIINLIPNVLFIGAYTAAIYYVEYDVFMFDFKPTSTVFSLLGIVLGLLLVFRTNTAYDRWWEGRKIWGALVDNTRGLAIKINSYLPESDKDTKTYFASLISNYPFALKEHLRNGVKFEELEETYPGFIEELKAYTHRPNRITSLIHLKLTEQLKNGVISHEQLLDMDSHINVMAASVGGCERIKNTPIPESYSKHLDRFVLIYSVILPFGFMHDLGWWSVPTIMIIYFALEGIKVIGEEIEDPFGDDANDLKTDLIAGGIKKSVTEILLGPNTNK